MKSEYLIEYIINGSSLRQHYMEARFFNSVEDMAKDLSNNGEYEIYIKIKDKSNLGYFCNLI